MKINTPPTRANNLSAFTLIEMIGVLAVIAILAAMLIPKVFQAINNARVNNAAVSTETIKTATADHYGKYGKLDQEWGTNAVIFSGGGNYCYNYETNLIQEGLLDKPFSVKIGGGDPSTNSLVELAKGTHENGGATGGYYLDGTGGSSTTNAQFVLEAVIYGVAAQDAKDLNDLIDGTALGAGNLTAADNKGRVEYAAPIGLTTTVYIYLTSR